MNKQAKRKISGLLLVLNSILFLLLEYITIIASRLTLFDAYTRYSISHISMPLNEAYLGIINNYSPMYNLLNTAFIIAGLVLLVCCFLELNKRINSNKLFYYPLMAITTVGFIMLGLMPAANTSLNNHQLAITMALLGGNLFLTIVGRNINTNKIHRYLSRILGLIGITSFINVLYVLATGNYIIYLGILERISLYTIIIWNLITGIYLVKQ